MTSSKIIQCFRCFERTFLTLLFLITTIPANSNSGDQCPKIGSPASVAMEFQLFSAYQTGFDGYETPCELKCFGKEKCQSSCQGKRGLEFLSKQMTKLKNKHTLTHCPSLTLNCIKQCEALGTDCANTCENLEAVAKN